MTKGAAKRARYPSPRGEEDPPTAAIQPLSCALLNSAMPCTGMIRSVSHSVSARYLSPCMRVCGVSVCVRARLVVVRCVRAVFFAVFF